MENVNDNIDAYEANRILVETEKKYVFNTLKNAVSCFSKWASTTTEILAARNEIQNTIDKLNDLDDSLGNNCVSPKDTKDKFHDFLENVPEMSEKQIQDTNIGYILPSNCKCKY